MKSSLFLPLFLPLLFLCYFADLTCCFSNSSLQPRCVEYERSALIEFKESFAMEEDCDDPESWKVIEGERSDDCCSWNGVECDEETNHVIGLDLSSRCFYGAFKSNTTLFRLAHLRKLNLAFNDFNLSRIPSELGLLSKLTHLNLSSSKFFGQIPSSISNLSDLVSLDLSNNQQLKLHKPSLEGLIQSLSNLKQVDFSYLNIYSTVPHILANMSSLEFLGLYSCGLIGEFPSAIFHLPNLRILELGSNPELTGYLSNFHPNSHLEKLLLAQTNFGGELSSSIGQLTHLKNLQLSYCNFTGKIPPSLGNLTQLVSLDLSDNPFNPDGLTTSSLSWMGKLSKLTGLFLHNIQLQGEIPQWLMNLTQVSLLIMNANQLTGPIPPTLTNMTRLSTVLLSFNRLSGHVPFQINAFASLFQFDLSRNELEGPIPAANLSNLPNLNYLQLDYNNFAGPVDLSKFLNLKKLFSLTMSFNKLSVSSGTISSNAKFPNMNLLGLASCKLSEFPQFLRNQDQLVFLDLSNNNLSGQIPSWITNLGLQSFDYLNLSHNHLTGFEQNPVILQWVQIRTIDLRFNLLQGSLPIPPLSTIYYLVSHNKFSGEVSSLICSLTSLTTLDLSFNNLSGKLPQCLGNFSDSLSLLDVKGNNFHRSIPSTWTNGCNLGMISLSHNNFQGEIPRSLANCTFLEFVDFGDNQIVDTFPFWLGAIPELSILILRSNRFYGVIDEFGDVGFSNLRVIDLSHNNFSGNLPSKYFALWNAMKVENASSDLAYLKKSLQPSWFWGSAYYGSFDYSMTLYNKGLEMNYLKIPDIFNAIDFSHNNFQGKIPDIIGNLTGLQLLNLSGNILTAQIPSSLANLRALESLDLSQNELSGGIPMQLVELTYLSSFDASFNHLSGPIPQGNQFCTFQIKSFEGNPELWVQTWIKQCGNFESNPSFSSPMPLPDGDEKSGFEMN
ncbi:receptor-like protein 7 [Mercurialis annua]|uniref:receptor-like protein 7 n=1 Tax=Mercurialis annua TaxID=3986 RepID=UPI00215E9A68|nr:receptor-like protein 7 [Mercurialis annua]